MTLSGIIKLYRIKNIKLLQNSKSHFCKCLIVKLINNKTKDENMVIIKNQKDILCNIYGATEEELKTISYVSKIELPAEFNRLDGCDLSIKTTNTKNMICMGDCLRVYDTIKTGKKLHMVVLHYKQNNNIKDILSIVEIDLTNSINELFGNITREQLVELDNIVKKVPQKRKPTYDEHKNMYDYHKKFNYIGFIFLDDTLHTVF
jgi:hypothetical protein